MTEAPTHPPMPPPWAERLAAMRLPADRREFVVGDLGEEFQHRLASQGPEAARRWYWRQAWRTAFGRHPRLLRPPMAPDMTRRPPPMPPILPDLRYALRGLRRQPGFTLAAVLTLALGIGANAAVFRVAWQVVLKPLPYPQADRLVHVWEAYTRGGRELTNLVAPGNYVDWQRGAPVFDAIGAYTALRLRLDLTGVGDPTQLETRYVVGDFFRTFNMPPLVGRAFAAADVKVDDLSPVVLSEHVWRQQFGGDPGLIGQTIRLGGVPHPVVGVMPEAFGIAGGATVDVWMGISLNPAEAANHGAHYLGVVARLKPGVSVDQAIAAVRAAARQDSLAFPASNKDTSATVEPMTSQRGGTFRPAIFLLAGAAGFVLLIACANLASLQLARSLSRAREFGIRTALGASRGRLVALLVVESAVLAIAGAAVGLTLSSGMLALLARVAPQTLRAGASAAIDLPTLLCAGLAAVVSVGLFASLPAWQAATRASGWINQRATTGDRRAALIRTVLVTGQLALATMLVVSATLLVTSLALVLRVDPGFDAHGVLAFDLTMPNQFADQDLLFKNVFRTVEALPGVTAACAINVIPFDETFNMTYVPQLPNGPAATAVGAFPRTITPGCFDVLRLRLLGGRSFTDREPTRVGIVTDSFARRAFPGANPIGQRVHLGVPEGELIEIVGVIADSLQSSLEARPYPQFYEVFSAQAAFPPTSVLVRTSVAPAAVFSSVRAAVRRIDPDQPVGRLRTLEDIVGTSTSERKFDLGLFLGFALIALALSAVGTYGLFAHVVAERRAEISIRMALGAVPEQVVRLMLRRAWVAIGLGLGVGVLGAYAASDALRHLLFGLSPTDPRAYVGVVLVLGTVALAAAWIPSRRAAQVDPVGVLRES
jgi:putative ABC transport system permease protein